MIINLTPSGPGDRYQSTVGGSGRDIRTNTEDEGWGGGKDFTAKTVHIIHGVQALARRVFLLYSRPINGSDERIADEHGLMDRSCGCQRVFPRAYHLSAQFSRTPPPPPAVPMLQKRVFDENGLFRTPYPAPVFNQDSRRVSVVVSQRNLQNK